MFHLPPTSDQYNEFHDLVAQVSVQESAAFVTGVLAASMDAESVERAVAHLRRISKQVSA